MKFVDKETQMQKETNKFLMYCAGPTNKELYKDKKVFLIRIKPKRKGKEKKGINDGKFTWGCERQRLTI